MVDFEQKQILDIFLHDRLAGHLIFDGSIYEFNYHESYLAWSDALPLSLSLPLTKEPKRGKYGGRGLPPYFYHLLPEGWLLSLAKMMKIPSTPMALLSMLLIDTIGAIKISPHNHTPPHSPELDLTKEPLLLDSDLQGPADFVAKHHLCLYCGAPLVHPGLNDNYHPACASDLFGMQKTPRFTIDRGRIKDIAAEQLRRGETLTGVQEKFSLRHRKDRKTIAPPLSYFVAKPQPWAPDLTQMANLEGAYMLFARMLGLPVAKSGIIYLTDGTACFISRRFDITPENTRIHQEDMAAPLERYDKYESSHEGVARILVENKTISEADSHNDRLSFIKITLFNFFLGNTDAHLKNFALFHFLTEGGPAHKLTPFYDIFPSLLYAPKDTDELGIALGNRKNKLKKRDFENLARLLKLGPRTVSAFINSFRESREQLIQALTAYHVSNEFQFKVLDLARIRLNQLQD